MPPATSGAPPSSVLMCAVSAQMTASQWAVMARSETTFAAVPLKTGQACARSPKWRRKTSCRASV